MTAPWRDQVNLGNQNANSVPEFRSSYPELAGMRPIVRGELITLAESPRKRFNFLVNPSDIASSYGVSDALDITNPDMLTGSEIRDLSDGLNTISFTLLLDRTYEVHRGSSAYNGGVLHDVLALEQVLGVPPSQVSAINANDSLASQFVGRSIGFDAVKSPSYVLSGLITKKYLRALFGARNAFSFDGFVDSLSIHYTHFSHQMVPTRAGVSISMRSIGTQERGGPTQAQNPAINYPNFTP